MLVMNQTLIGKDDVCDVQEEVQISCKHVLHVQIYFFWRMIVFIFISIKQNQYKIPRIGTV